MSRRIVLALLALAAAVPVRAETAEAIMQTAGREPHGEADRLPRGAPGRAGRRLPRHQGRRPVPLAGGPRLAPRRAPGSRPRTRSPFAFLDAIPERERDPASG